MNTKETLNAIRANQGGCSDYRLAKLLGCTRQTVSMWLSSNRTMSDLYRIKAAKLLNDDPAIHIMWGEIERAKCTDTKRYLNDAIRRLGNVAASIFIVLSLTLTPANEARAGLKNNDNKLYIMRIYQPYIISLFRWLTVRVNPFLQIIIKKDVLCTI